MANSARTQPGVEPQQPEIQDIVEVNPLDQVTFWYEKYKKAISTSLTVVVVAVVGYVGYQKWYKEPEMEKATAAMAMPQLYFQADSMNLALNGDGKNLGFLKIQKKYEGTPAANLANYYAGIAYLKTGDFKNAIKHLSAFDGKGTILGYQAKGNLGIAYLESGDVKKAIDNFQKAIENKDDNIVTPTFLYHLALAYEADKQADKAKETFKRIRDEYPRSIQASEMDKELARLGELN